ncbi:hypothetical protein D9M70_514540 [compost metagenome]
MQSEVGHTSTAVLRWAMQVRFASSGKAESSTGKALGANARSAYHSLERIWPDLNPMSVKRGSLDIPRWKTASRVFHPITGIRLRRADNAFLVHHFFCE